MKRIILMRMQLRDFKGMSFTLDAHGEDVNISGKNATGKTTIADAFSWILFDKDSLGRADFEIKNINANGEAEHNLEHSVEVVLAINDQTVTLKKVYHELWTKKRGSATREFTGHTTDYYVDGVPVQKKDYQAQIADIAGDESVFRLLTSPTAFPALHWQKQRALLLEVCGDISDQDVIFSDENLSTLPAILGKHKLDDYKKIITSRRTEINKELEKIPVRIDEQRRSLPNVDGLDRDTLIKEKSRLETAISDAKLRRQGVDTGGKIADLTKKLAIINADIAKLERNHFDATMKSANKINQQINEIEIKRDFDTATITRLKKSIDLNNATMNSTNKHLERLRREWADADALFFQDTTVDTCAACGQTLPAAQVQEAREKARAIFNQDKANKLEMIDIQGKRLRQEYDTATAENETLINQKNAIEIRIPDMTAEHKSLSFERDKIKAMAEDYFGIPGRNELVAKKNELNASIQNEKEGVSENSQQLLQEISALQKRLDVVSDDLNRFAKLETTEKRIEELKANEKQLAADFERLERELYLCEQFIRTKVGLLTDRINSRFEIARFKLFDVQINGGLTECCEIMVNGIPFNSGLNNAARINAGLDVCRTLSEHYGLRAPIFVDNAESVCELISMQTQVIRLVVSEHDAVLRVETAGEKIAA